MKDVKSVFRSIEKNMKQAGWFANGWEIYNRGVYIQLYKSNWYNHKQGGIHFETYIEADQIKKKEFLICMHAEEDCPAQQDFIRSFLSLKGQLIGSWKGYKVIGRGYRVCERKIPLNFKNLEHRLLEEFNRLRLLESGIEEVLQSRGVPKKQLS